MDAASLLPQLADIGLRVRPDGSNLRIAPRHCLTPELRALLLRYKPALLEYLTSPTPLTGAEQADIEEALAERAAIYEFDAGMSRADAEDLARAAVRIYRVRRADGWKVMILGGANLDRAERHARCTFDGVLEVREESRCTVSQYP